MQTFGKYEIVAKIGEGGFGVVYEGFDPRIERRVAVKTCPTDDQTLRQRFLHEARISGNLHHRHIIVVYDYGEEEDVPYLVQEFLTGEDLDRKIARGDDLPFETKLDYLIQIAEGLDFAHRQGVIHRDIKPSNIRILDDGQVKIMDFGIAKLRDSELALTLPGQTVGTPAYLAPEQIRNVEADARCDIYSFGLVGYELLTYRKAFPSRNASRVLYQVLNEEPPRIAELWPECPAEVERILERCYRKDRDERWERMSQVAEALRAVLAGEAAPAEPAARAGARLAIDDGSATMVTPGGSLEQVRQAIRQGGGLDQLVLGGLAERSAPSPGATAPSPTEPSPSASRLPLVALAVIAALVIAWLGYRFVSRGAAPTDQAVAAAAEPADATQADAEPSPPTEAEAEAETVASGLQPAQPAPARPVQAPRVELAAAPDDAEPPGPEPTARPPGALTVRAGLGGPRLRVTIDGEEAGFTPLNARLLAPGSHLVAVGPETASEDAVERSYTVDLASQEEVVLTFDLRRAEPSIARRPYRN
jgi:eukaryotic-like serine/threonine-protein kinase